MNGKHIILRTSWVFGEHGANFLKTILRLANERDSLNIIDDQFGAPTSARLLAKSTAAIAEELLNGGLGKFGTYHLACEGETTWYRYARQIVEIANQAGLDTKCMPRDIKPISTEAYPLPAPRPKNSKMGLDKLKDAYGIEVPHWSIEVELVVTQLINNQT